MMVLQHSKIRISRWATAVAVAAMSFTTMAAFAKNINVPMTGEGVTEAEATANALSEALTEILNELQPAHNRKGQSYDWTRRLVAARPAHVIKGHYKIAESSDPRQNRGTGLWRVRINVKMPTAAFEAAWEEAEAFVEAIGEPRVGIAMQGDWIEDTRVTPPRPRLDQPSAVAQAIKEALHGQHFQVVILEHKNVLTNSHMEFAKLNAVDTKVLAQLALGQKADLLITADAKTLGPTKSQRTAGKVKWDWKAFCSASIFWSDDASELGTISGGGLGADDNPEAGRIVSLRNAGNSIANDFLDKVFEQWSDWAFEGQVVTLTALGANYSTSRTLEKAIKAMPGILKVTSRQSLSGVTTIRFRTKLPTIVIADQLYDIEFSNFALEIDDANLRTIRARVK